MSTLHQSIQIKNSNRKCGEISYCIQVGKRVYALNCLYCSQICLQWDIFINHMEQEHNDKLNLDSVLNVEENVSELQENLIQNEYSKMLQQNTNNSLFNKTDETDRLPFNDPLEDENSINSISMESSIKVENLDYPSHQTMVENNMDSFECDKNEIDKNDDKMDFNTQFTRNDDNQAKEFSIKRDIREIKEKLDTNNKLVKQLFEEIKLIQHNHISNTTKILPKTPFESKEAFLKFETKIQESEQNFANMVRELKERVNGNSVKFIKNCWRLLIKDEVAKEFCWQGSKEKTEIKNFSTLLAIKQSYAQKYTDSNATEFERISEQNYNSSEQDLNDDFSLQSSSSCNDNNIDDNKNFVFDKSKFTELIIKYYKDYPVLWQSNHSEHKNIPKHQEVYKKITKLINKEMNLNLKCIQIKGKINKLKCKFRKEHEFLTEFSNCNENDMDIDDISTALKNTSWLYEQLSFLKDHISDRRKRSKRGSKALTNDKNYLPLAKFSLDENQQFIKLYKSYPCLWDVNHIGFRFKNQRQDSLQELLQAVNNQLNLELSSEDLQKKLYCLRYAITKEKHRHIECEKLKIEFIPQCKLYNELLFLKDSVGPFKCEYCEQIFNGPDQYKVHKSSHDGSMPYSCPQCNKGFMKIGNCTVHLRRHTKDFQFECQECGKKFPTSTDLNVHTRHHTGEKPYFCDICGQSFRTWTYFNSHRRRHEKKPNHICSICSKSFYEHSKLKQHMKSHMNVRDKVCNICGKSFTCTKYLNQHKLTHAEKKKYSCKICGKKFAQHGGLSNHIKSHNTIATNEAIDNDIVSYV